MEDIGKELGPVSRDGKDQGSLQRTKMMGHGRGWDSTLAMRLSCQDVAILASSQGKVDTMGTFLDCSSVRGSHEYYPLIITNPRSTCGC